MTKSTNLADLRNWHREQLRVRYADTDRMGVVYHSNYFIYFEACRSDLIRHLWKSYYEIEKDGYRLLVIHAACRYRKAAEYDDLLNVYGKIASFTDTRLRFEYMIFRQKDDALIVDGFTEHCFADHHGKPRRMPEELKKILMGKLGNHE
jgi:acyl-CoA thioester hydrolase